MQASSLLSGLQDMMMVRQIPCAHPFSACSLVSDGSSSQCCCMQSWYFQCLFPFKQFCFLSSSFYSFTSFSVEPIPCLISLTFYIYNWHILYFAQYQERFYIYIATSSRKYNPFGINCPLKADCSTVLLYFCTLCALAYLSLFSCSLYLYYVCCEKWKRKMVLSDWIDFCWGSTFVKWNLNKRIVKQKKAEWTENAIKVGNTYGSQHAA